MFATLHPNLCPKKKIAEPRGDQGAVRVELVAIWMSKVYRFGVFTLLILIVFGVFQVRSRKWLSI